MPEWDLERADVARYLHRLEGRELDAVAATYGLRRGVAPRSEYTDYSGMVMPLLGEPAPDNELRAAILNQWERRYVSRNEVFRIELPRVTAPPPLSPKSRWELGGP